MAMRPVASRMWHRVTLHLHQLVMRHAFRKFQARRVACWESFDDHSPMALWCSSLAISHRANEVFITMGTLNYVRVCDADTGKGLRRWGSHGAGAGQFNRPFGVCVVPFLCDGLECVVIADTFNGRVCLFHTDGTFVRSLCFPNTQWPTHVAVTVEGELIVIGQSGRGRANAVSVARFTDGTIVREWRHPALVEPFEDMDLTGTGNVVLSDRLSCLRVYRIRDGALLHEVTPLVFRQPHAISCVSRRGTEMFMCYLGACAVYALDVHSYAMRKVPFKDFPALLLAMPTGHMLACVEGDRPCQMMICE